MEPYDPTEDLPPVPSFEVTSTNFANRGPMAPSQYATGAVPGGRDASPQLSWTGWPEATRSFAVTMVDPDAPIPGVFWHWAAVNIPVEETSITENASRSGMPEGTLQLFNELGEPGYTGAAPPVGHGKHRYFVMVHALDVPLLDVAEDTRPGVLSMALRGHTLARGLIVGTAERPGS
ncbi:YbhB/YbcL family Raf kinase inhibitor-like protein [Arthrobacter sp. NPDC055585]